MKKFLRAISLILILSILSYSCAMLASCTSGYYKFTGEIKIAPAYWKTERSNFFVDQELAIVLSAGETEAYMEIEYDGNQHIPVGRSWFRAYDPGYKGCRWIAGADYIYSSIWREDGEKDELFESICEKGVYHQAIYYYGKELGEKTVFVTIVIK